MSEAKSFRALKINIGTVFSYLCTKKCLVARNNIFSSTKEGLLIQKAINRVLRVHRLSSVGKSNSQETENLGGKESTENNFEPLILLGIYSTRHGIFANNLTLK